MTARRKTESPLEEAAGDPVIDRVLDLVPAAVTDDDLRAFVARQRELRAMWMTKQAGKGKEE